MIWIVSFEITTDESLSEFFSIVSSEKKLREMLVFVWFDDFVEVPFGFYESFRTREPDVSSDPELREPPQNQHPLLVLGENVRESAGPVAVKEQVGRDVRSVLTRLVIVSLTKT